jgi:hypothetical protein
METAAEIFHYEQVISPCGDGSCCGGEVCSVQVDVVADGVNLSSKRIPPHGGVNFAVPAGTSVVVTATPMLSGGVPQETFTREFASGDELVGEAATIFGDLSIRKKVSLED